MKKKYIYILFFIILIIIYLVSVIKIENEWKMYVQSDKYRIYNCTTNIDNYCSTREDYQTCINFCNGIPLKVSERRDIIFVFADYLLTEPMFFFPYYAMLVVGTVATYEFIHNLKTGNIRYILTRINYNKYIKKEWLKSMRFIFAVPLLYLAFFITAYFFSSGFNMSTIYNSLSRYFSYKEGANLFVHVTLSILSMILQGVLWINIFYIFAKKSKSHILSIIISYLSFLGLWICSEIPELLVTYKNNETYYFLSLGEMWMSSDNVLGMFLVQLFLALVSTVLVYKIYKNKEEVMINNEV